MTNHEQRIALAKACGWIHQQGDWWIDPQGRYTNYQPPDYLNDLNAVHEAEKVLTPEQVRKYVEALHWGIPGADMSFCESLDDAARHVYPAITATAAQRTKALLLTLSLWKI